MSRQNGFPVDRQAARFHRGRALVVTGCALAAAVAVLLAAACASTSSRESTAEALTAILAGDQRPPEERARDGYRHPKETLLFFGIRPETRVLEVWPEPGWYTAVIAPLVRDKGKYFAGTIAADPSSKYITHRREEYQARLAARPDLYDRVVVVNFAADGGDAVPPGSVDMVLTFRNIHNWMARDQAAQAHLAESTSRISPSCAVLATKVPSRAKTLARAKPRAPEALGLSTAYSSQSSTRNGRWNHIA